MNEMLTQFLMLIVGFILPTIAVGIVMYLIRRNKVRRLKIPAVCCDYQRLENGGARLIMKYKMARRTVLTDRLFGAEELPYAFRPGATYALWVDPASPMEYSFEAPRQTYNICKDLIYGVIAASVFYTLGVLAMNMVPQM